MAKIDKIGIKLTYRLIEECNDIIEEYDLEKEARVASELIEKSKEMSSDFASLFIQSELKKLLTRDRKKQLNIGQYKIYCILKGLEYDVNEMMDADVEEVELIYTNFQNKIKSNK